jgi:hypothetical protein
MKARGLAKRQQSFRFQSEAERKVEYHWDQFVALWWWFGWNIARDHELSELRVAAGHY